MHESFPASPEAPQQRELAPEVAVGETLVVKTRNSIYKFKRIDTSTWEMVDSSSKGGAYWVGKRGSMPTSVEYGSVIRPLLHLVTNEVLAFHPTGGEKDLFTSRVASFEVES